MIAILIFAGRSTRFWPLSEKNFFPMWGTNLLERQLKKLKSAGYEDILLVGGPHNVKEARKRFPTEKILTQTDADAGMRGALLTALPRCKKESVLIVSANDVIDEAAFRLLRKEGMKRKDGGLILARKVKTHFPGGYLKTKGKHILSIVEKPREGKEPSDLVNLVAHVHADASVLLQALQKAKSVNDDGYEQALDTLFKEHVYEAVPYAGSWHPVKYPWHLLDLLGDILPPNTKPVIPKSCVIHTTAVIEGAVLLGEGVRVMAHATIVGPCSIGQGSIVANNALVRGSSVGERCVIGYNTEIARSILGNDVWTHSSYVGDSVLASDVSLAAGTVTGNLRLDEEPIVSTVRGEKVPTHRTKFGVIIGAHSRTGIHTCLLPGVKIGEHSFISSGSIVNSDVPDRSFLKDGVHRPNRVTSTVNRSALRKKI
ncbi:hypothetical protein EXS65_02675 [Candidatus Peribacteria bacterium]|nr:hypothetical protein [Candidatus Peribacteria bacterium]